MTTLLVVLAIACAVAIALPLARGAVTRARSVERHRQALDTLAGITQSGSESTAGHGSPDRTATAQGPQAHVRLLVPGSDASDTADPGGAAAADLPPPRPFARTPGRSSPFRRPARRGGLIGTVAGAGRFPEGAAPANGRNGAPDAPGPQDQDERPTRALPVVPPPVPPAAAQTPAGPRGEQGRSHVFYFDDLPAVAVPPPPPPSGPLTVPRDDASVPAAHAEGPPTAAVPVPPPAPPRRYVPLERPAPTRTDEGPHPIGEGPAPLTPAPVAPGVPGTDLSDIHADDAGETSSLIVIDEDAGPRAPAEAAAPRPRRVLAVAAASTAVLAAGLGGALVLTGGGNNTKSASPPATSPASGSRARTATSRTAPVTTARPSTTTSTTAPPRPASLVSATAGSAVYQLRSPNASIVVSATGPCWIEVRAGSAQGQVVYEGILAAGQTSSVTGPAWMRLGDPPNAKVAVDGTRMKVPGAEAAVPVNLQFTLG